MSTKLAMRMPKLIKEFLNFGKVLVYGAFWRLICPLSLVSMLLKEHTLDGI